MENSALKKSVYVLLFLFLLFAALYYAKPFLVPLTFAGFFSMLLLPLCVKMENIGLNKGIAILLSILILVLFFAGIIYLLAWQISDMRNNAAEIERNVNEKFNQIKDYISINLNISRQKQSQIIQREQSSMSGNLTGMVSAVIGSVGNLLANTILMLVYVFLLLFFRVHFKNFILKVVPPENRQKAVKTMRESKTVAQKYLGGLALMIVCLWIMYAIGFSIVGVKNAIFFAILCGLLEIVPFVGNLTGTLITVLMSIAQGGSMGMVLGVLATYGSIQFVQTYILEPLVVGSGVNLNPLFTIAGIVGGELIWGIPGMILALPTLGIVKIICDNVETLKPYGYLIGLEKKRKEHALIHKIKKKLQ